MIRRGILAIVAALAAASAWTFVPWDLDPDDFTHPVPSAAPPRPGVPVRVSLLPTGVVPSRELLVYRGGGFRRRSSAIVAFLVEHPSGSVLVDTGFGSTVDAQTAGDPWWTRLLLPYEATDTVVARLAREGWGPDRIGTIILTHSHWDHASGIPDLPGARVLVTPEERAFLARARRPVVIPEQFEGAEERLQDVVLDGPPYEGFARSHDLHGDGTIVLVPLPGHTPGSIGVFVNLRSGKRLLFTGDLTWALEGIERPAERPLFSRLFVDDDPARVRASIVAVHQLRKARPGLIVVPAHDARAHGEIPTFPKALE